MTGYEIGCAYLGDSGDDVSFLPPNVMTAVFARCASIGKPFSVTDEWIAKPEPTYY